MFYLRLFLLLITVIPLYSTENLRIVFPSKIEEIDSIAAKDLLVKTFMTAYEDVPLVDLDPHFKSIGDVRRFYEAYFDSELNHYKEGGLIFVLGFIENKLVGFATFEMEPYEKNGCYMNLLVVDKDYQGLGIGKNLTFSMLTKYPKMKSINVLVRKVNLEAYAFYKKIGFFEHTIVRDNFVDPSLLTGMRWEKKIKFPFVVKKKKPKVTSD
jgi:ribosomal protein S18 acetylase RimI-like enzyme